MNKTKCLYCEKEIRPSRGNYIAPDRVTCGSKVCIRKRHKERHGKTNLNYMEEMRKCDFCKGDFLWKSTFAKKRFCGKECADINSKKKYFKIQGSGESYNFLKVRFEILKRDDFTCQYCGRNVKEDKIKLQLDHILPKKKGGSDNPNNLITACEECNLGKRDILLTKKFFSPRYYKRGKESGRKGSN